MKTTPLLKLTLISLLLTLFGCKESEVDLQKELELQKKEWVKEMVEAFPQRTKDTVELERRLNYFIESGNKVGQSTMYRIIGNEARASSLFRKAIEYHTKGLQIAYEINDTVSITMVMNDLATDFRRLGAFDEASPYHYLALQIAEEYKGNDTLLIERTIASAYNGIGSICRVMNEYDEAIRVYKKALALEQKYNNYRGVAINYANLGAVYFTREEYERAEEYYLLSLENNERDKNPMGIALCRINIGRIHEVKGDLDGALSQFMKAHDVLSGTSDKWHWLDACFQVANILIKKGNYTKANNFLKSGLETALEINSIKHLQKAYSLYSLYNYNLGNYKASVENIGESHRYGEILQQNLEMDRLLESRVKYETEKYSKQIDQLDQINQEQLARRRSLVFIFIALVILLLALILVLFYKRRLDKRQTEESKSLEQMRANFFTNITHEFRTPLTVINGLSSHLRSQVEEGTKEAKDLDAIKLQGKQLQHLVNQLLDFSRSEAGVGKPKWRNGDIIEFLKAFIESYSQYAETKGINLFLYSEEESLVFNYAPSHVKKVIGNLLSNAIKHCEPGDQIVIHIKWIRENNLCQIEVSDSGAGIAPENLPNIFKLFYTAGSQNIDHIGSGIGLALSKQLVEEIGGTISVTSTEGKGSRFIITVPASNETIAPEDLELFEEEFELVKSELDLVDSELELVDSELYTPRLNGKNTILIVEDNRDVVHYLSTILENRYSLLFAFNGGEGLLAAEHNFPDLIITDVMMPEKDGYSLTQEIRQSVALSHIPIIMLTAKESTDDKLEGLKAGADAYIVKPFDERVLLAQIKQLLESRASLRESYTNSLMGGEAKESVVESDLNLAFINKLSAVVNDNLAEGDFFPKGLADEMCLSESQLNRKLKAMTGHTISSFVMRARLNKAKQMLSKRNKNITEVAFSCGFNNLGYFSRSFKKAFGYTPSQYLKKPENNNPS